MDATGFFQPIVWTFLPTPLARDLLAAINPRLTIYYCIDDFASSSPGAKRIVASEERLFRDADLVFVTSERLRQRAARFSDRVHLFPFGVSFERFDAVRRGADAVPADLAGAAAPGRRLRRRPPPVDRSGSVVGGRDGDAGRDVRARSARSRPTSPGCGSVPTSTCSACARTTSCRAT